MVKDDGEEGDDEDSGGDDVCVCVCVFAVLDIVNILDLFLAVVITHTAPSLGLFVPSHTSVLLRSSSV